MIDNSSKTNFNLSIDLKSQNSHPGKRDSNATRCAFECYLTQKVHDYDEKQTNSNQDSRQERDRDTVVVKTKRKTRAKRGFPSHKSSPKRNMKQKVKHESKRRESKRA